MRALVPMMAIAAAILPVLSSAATLQAGSSAGDTASVVAICGAGANDGGDVRGCVDRTPVPLATAIPGTTYTTAASATYANGNSASASTAATVGTLHAWAEASIPLSDGGHNLQSRADVRLLDSLLASSSLGSLYNNYAYNVVITGSTTTPSELFALPRVLATAFVNLVIFDDTAFKTLVHTTWEASTLVASGGATLTGSIAGVPANDHITFDLTLSVGAGVNTSDAGQSGFARADYSNTVHFFFDALTPGANTVAESGHDYASPAPVPVPGAGGLLMAGCAALVSRGRRNARPSTPRRATD